MTRFSLKTYFHSQMPDPLYSSDETKRIGMHTLRGSLYIAYLYNHQSDTHASRSNKSSFAEPEYTQKPASKSNRRRACKSSKAKTKENNGGKVDKTRSPWSERARSANLLVCSEHPPPVNKTIARPQLKLKLLDPICSPSDDCTLSDLSKDPAR